MITKRLFISILVSTPRLYQQATGIYKVVHCADAMLLVHPTMLRAAAAAYTCNFKRYSQAQDADANIGIAKMGRRHPYFSPALGKLSENAFL